VVLLLTREREPFPTPKSASRSTVQFRSGDASEESSI
jgi:hypothetical protein